jgi:hypothetical protein
MLRAALYLHVRCPCGNRIDFTDVVYLFNHL